jgi:hypothetical protein
MSQRWIGFSEDDAQAIAEDADIRRQSRTIFNALSVKLRGSHAPLRRTTRSTLRLAHLFVNTFGLRKNEFIPSRFTGRV